MLDLIILIIGTCLAAIFAYKVKSLTISGVFGTIIVGSLVSLGFGYGGLFLLGAFFASSSYWSKYKKEQKYSLSNVVEKGEQRDIVQVFANGGVAALASLLYIFTDSNIALYIFIGAIATANADTWASEIGTLSKQKPILLTKLKKVEPGTSGAVSILGTVAALFGALFICFISMFFWEAITFEIFIYLSIIGFSGNIIDTILGATIQVQFYCSTCGLKTEKTFHCQTKTKYHKGIVFFDNDVVNFLSILLSSVCGGLVLVHFFG